MEELRKIIKGKYVSIETKAKTIHILVFPVTMYRYESWTVKKTDRKNDSFEIWCWSRALQIPWSTRKMNKWFLEQIKLESLLEVNMTKLKLSYYRNITRGQGNAEKNRR